MKVFLNERIHIGGEDWIPDSSEDFNKNILTLLDTLQSFLFLNDVEVLYSGPEINRLFNNIINVEEFSDYSITNPVQRIRQILIEVESIDWTLSKKHKDDFYYHYVYSLGAQTQYVNNSSISEACEFKHVNEQVLLINFLSSNFNKSQKIHVSRANINPPNDINTYPLDFLVDNKQCIDWYHANRPKRTYTWNKKHGENGNGIIPNKGESVSPLECSRQEAAEYLEIAIGYRRTNELYNYDPKNMKYMVWKCDAPGHKSYHAYHPINQNEIDSIVKEFIDEL